MRARDKLDDEGYPPATRNGDIDGICAAARAYALAGVTKDEMNKELGYLENNAPRMRYKRSFHAGVD